MKYFVALTFLVELHIVDDLEVLPVVKSNSDKYHSKIYWEIQDDCCINGGDI